MAALPQMVQSAKGQMFDVNSPQGKMIVNSPNYKPPFSFEKGIEEYVNYKINESNK